MPCNRHNLSRFEDQTRKDTPQQNGQGDRGIFRVLQELQNTLLKFWSS